MTCSNGDTLSHTFCNLCQLFHVKVSHSILWCLEVLNYLDLFYGKYKICKFLNVLKTFLRF